MKCVFAGEALEAVVRSVSQVSPSDTLLVLYCLASKVLPFVTRGRMLSPRARSSAFRIALCAVFALMWLCVDAADAQSPLQSATPDAYRGAPPAYLLVVEGNATIEHEGESEPAAINMPLADGDHVRTANGRVVVRCPDGGTIDIDPDSDVEFITATRVRVIAGAIEHRAAEPPDRRSDSAQYLPADLQVYDDALDRSGSWQYNAPYGYVWYPTVTPDWRPYYDGYWSPIRTIGWTWIGSDAWSWPTHHYGRWGYARNAWFWIPGRAWGPAWVSWADAVDYVSWCPLGFDGRPVFALSIHDGSRGGGWTIVSRRTFGARDPVNRHAIDRYRVASNTPFIEHARPPVSLAREWARPRESARPRELSRERESSVTSRQSSVDGRRPSVENLAARPPGRQASGEAVAVERSQAMPRPATPGASGTPRAGAPPTRDYRPPTTDSRLPAPDSRASAPPRQTLPEYRRAPAPDYRAVTPGYRSPEAPRTADDRRSTLSDPRVGTRPATDVRPSAPPATDYRPPTRDSRPPTPDSHASAPPRAEGRAQERPSAGQPRSGGESQPQGARRPR